ncbi:MAG: DUF2461 domain-containing protein [Candidatus Dormibacteria bacterium]
MAAARPHFTPALFEFLGDLGRHNDRQWFLRNRGRYEEVVRDPAIHFIEDIEPRLRRISAHLVADPRPVGGSLFRIHRDIRFSTDKSPYKTNIGMSFGLDAGRGVPAPGFYVHIAPGASFVGGGVHMPDSATLHRVRNAIVTDTRAWKRIITNAEFAPLFTNMGDTLKRAPQGFDADHPFVDDLKRKSYTWHGRYDEAAVCAPGFLDDVTKSFRVAAPFMRFLAEALGDEW